MACSGTGRVDAGRGWVWNCPFYSFGSRQGAGSCVYKSVGISVPAVSAVETQKYLPHHTDLLQTWACHITDSLLKVTFS